MKKALVLSAVIILIDQIVKFYMLGLVFDPPRVLYITSFFNLVPVWNEGISFGLFPADSWGRWILVGVTSGVVAFLIYWLQNPLHSTFFRLAMGLVIGGAIGNIIDRIRFGAVVDFFDFHYAGFHWPAFNVADSAITVGVMCLIIEHFTNGKKHATKSI